MKKNKMMRLASAMLMMTLLTTSVISGTFAKYVTSDTATDTARVAKFGVTVTAGGYLFDETYKAADDDGPGGDGDVASMTVVSVGKADTAKKDNVVAPGTKNDDGITFTISGTPEVDVKLEIKVESDQDIFLAKKTGLPKMTTGKNDDTFDNTSKYEPIKYTLLQKKSDDTDFAVVSGAEKVNLSTLSTKLESFTEDYDANTNLAAEVGTLKIIWEWDFGTAGTYDDQDTLLGDLAAIEAGESVTLVPTVELVKGMDKDYNLTTGLTITVSVTQID